uniref:Myosin motor domain-containing protein n=1 Tax=Haemonchus contortus TaxID=6289 RepID=A0A7I4Z6U8_HAECO
MGSKDPPLSENLLNLTDINETSVLDVIEERFNNKRIYTNVGGVLLAVNPLEKYRIYDEAVMAQYQQFNKVASMCSREHPEWIELRKHNIQIEAINTIFNSFGCAKTVKNDQATRFGYCMDFLYNKNTLSGLSLRTTLPLETIRVVSQKAGERNFNVFYELCAGMSSEIKASYGIRDQQKFFYLTQGKVGEDGGRDDMVNFSRLHASLEIVGFSEEQRQIIYKTLATILHLGNMYFRQRRNTADDSEYVEVGNDAELKWASYLLDVDMHSFAPCFTHKITKTDEGVTKMPYSMGQALDARDALAMSLYELVFNWILNRISLHLKCADHNAVISVVDCYGIERYNNNGLEQLLINSVNEKLQNAFVKQTFYDEIADYVGEGLIFDWKMPSTLDNEKAVDLLCKKPYGLLYLIDDECKFPKASDESYLRHCNLNHLDKNVYGKAKNKDRLQMSVRHFFGTTWYNVHGFVQRNKRSLPGQVVKILAESQNPVISMLFRPIANGKEGADYVVYAAQQFNTASTAMIEKILSGNSHFVRCVKCNSERIPARLDVPSLSRQLKSLCIMETLLFRRVGYPVRIPFERFAQSYRCLLPSDIALCQKQKEIIVDILDGQGLKFAKDFQIGTSYVFLRDRLADQLQALREKTQRDAAYVIQKTMRTYVARKRYLRKRRAIVRLQAGLRGWKARKECSALREQMFKNLSNQTKRNRRLNAYHETLLTTNPDQKCPGALLGCFDVENFPSKQLDKTPSESKPKIGNMKITTDYLPVKLKSRIGIVEPVTIEKFAEENFKGHLLEPRREPILTPFLHKENDLDFRLSIEVFKLILKYMNDQTLNRTQLDDLARYIVKQGINNPCQRDEIFVQICNQIYRNPDKEATSRCCRLLLQAVGVFAPTENVLPMLISFCGEQRLPLQTQLMNTIARRMNMLGNQTARLLPASRLEMGALCGFHNAAVEVTSQDGQAHMVEAHPWITNEELANNVLRHRGIGNPSGWSVEVETDNVLYCPTGVHFLHDVISEIEHGKEENKKSFFYSYPTDRTLPPVNKKKVDIQVTPTQVKVLSPVMKRQMRQANESRDRSMDANRSGSRCESRRDRSLDSLRNANQSPQLYRKVYHEAEQEPDYCYALPVKHKQPNDAPPRTRYPSYGSPRRERSEDIPPELPKQPVPNSSMTKFEPSPYRSPSQSQHRYTVSQERMERHNPTPPNQYYPQPNVQMVQYVPVMMAPQPMMFSAPMNQALVQQPVLVPAPAVPVMTPHRDEASHWREEDHAAAPMSHRRDQSTQSHSNTSEDRSRDYDTVKSVNRPEFDSYRSYSSAATRVGECDSRAMNASRSDYVPSVYSTMSVASRIRNMPVPNSSRDVDRFLDEVFDQVLSPHEMAVEMSAHEIAASIKGGAYGPSDYEPAYQKAGPTYQQNYSGHYLNNGTDSDQYNYVDREALATRSLPRQNVRSRSLPRYNPPHENPPPTYRHNQEDSIDSYPSDVGTMRELAPSSHCTPGSQRSVRTHETLKPNGNVYEPQQQMVFMMPMQMSASNGQMMPVLMAPGMMAPPAGQNMMYCPMPTQQKYQTSPRNRRHRSLDACSTATEDGAAYPPQQNLSPYHNSRNRGYGLAGSMSALRPEQQGAIPRPLPRSPSPRKSPNEDRRQNGLTRLPQDAYREPIVQNTMINSEHPNPRRFHIPEKNLVKEIQQKEQEALRKINERLKDLPPPVDEVRVYLPKKPVQVPEQVFAVTEPPPSQIYARPYSYVGVESEPPATEWIYEGEVERPGDHLDRSRSPAASLAVMPQQYDVDTGSTGNNSQKPAVRYVKQPWKLTIRKEMFHPQEKLDDVNVINQVFAQIISDCRKGIAYRIRAYERDDVVCILKSNNIPPELLNRQEEIPVDVKVAVITAARKWPLYFTQVYEVVEERLDESVSVLLSIGEHGIRLLLHTPLEKDNPLKAQDHFNFSDLADVTLESDELLCLHTRNGISIRLRTKMAPQIKTQIDKCMFGQVQRKKFVRATADYVTKQPNLLSFKKGDTIELVPLPNGEVVPSGSWLYGKIGNRYGSLPAQYVIPLDEHNREVEDLPSTLPLVYDDVMDDVGHMNGSKYTMLEFALNHFRGPKGSDPSLKRNRKEWTWQDVAHKIKFTDKPISHSLIRFDSSELDKLACETFMCIMRYMGDEPIRRGETITDAVYRLLLICHKNPALRDEVYCQIIRQTTNNKSTKPDSSIRGWRLFSILTAYFESSLALRPYLINYLAENADDQRRAYHGTAQLCLQNLNQTMRYGGRKYLLSGMEVEEITNGKILKRQVYTLPGGNKKVVNTKSITVVEEAIRELCLELNIRSPSEQQEFCLCYVLEKDNRTEYCANDDYILDICTELEHKRVPFHFLLRRCTWVHPLRLDHPVYIDVMFFQVVPDYLQGSLLTRQASGHMSASVCDDVTKLAAYLHMAANEGQRIAVTPRTVQTIVPAPVLEYPSPSPDSWASRINRQLRTMNPNTTATQARAAFLEILSTWPLFGSTIFRLDAASFDGRALPPVELAVGRTGVKLLEPRSRDVVEHWPYDKIVSAVAGHRDTVVEMVVGTPSSNRTYEFRTNESLAITRLVGQYTFIVNENRGLLND